jgi:hypothetical protein
MAQQVSHTLCLTPVARIIKSTADSALDRFIPLDVAKRMYIEGKLTDVDMGPDYPDSYMEV